MLVFTLVLSNGLAQRIFHFPYFVKTSIIFCAFHSLCLVCISPCVLHVLTIFFKLVFVFRIESAALKKKQNLSTVEFAINRYGDIFCTRSKRSKICSNFCPSPLYRRAIKLKPHIFTFRFSKRSRQHSTNEIFDSI